MGLMNFFKNADINAGVEQYRNTEGAVLLDVRTAEEYAGGHIPGSVNLPLQELSRAEQFISDKRTPLFVHCLSGARSRQAVSVLKGMGYTDAANIGGIGSYRGKVEK